MKRVFDFLIALVAFVILAPILIAVGIGVRIALGKPVLFSQERPGLREKPFTLYKFRTMLPLTHGVTDDKSRLTTFGAFLRATSLDELPELWNVVKGDMSLVGPRPLLMEYLDLYTPEQGRRHEVRPGITGWAQVNGRNALSWNEKFALDVWYVENRSILLDLKVLWLTVWQVLSGCGVSHSGEATMPRFRGSD